MNNITVRLNLSSVTDVVSSITYRLTSTVYKKIQYSIVSVRFENASVGEKTTIFFWYMVS